MTAGWSRGGSVHRQPVHRQPDYRLFWSTIFTARRACCLGRASIQASTAATLFALAASGGFSSASAASAACEWGPCAPVLKTSILELRRDGAQARELLRLTRTGGYDLAGGGYQSFSRWYAGRLTPVRADLVTQVTPGLGLLWGVSTGENGEKYTLQPGFRAGLVAVAPISRTTSMSFTARTTVGGRLREKPCTADYGEIGGVQKVNCRLAASDLAPQETLAHLWNFAPPDQSQLTVRLTFRF